MVFIFDEKTQTSQQLDRQSFPCWKIPLLPAW